MFAVPVIDDDQRLRLGVSAMSAPRNCTAPRKGSIIRSPGEPRAVLVLLFFVFYGITDFQNIGALADYGGRSMLFDEDHLSFANQ